MGNKSFIGGINTLLGSISSKQKQGVQVEKKNASYIGTKQGEKRATFIVNEELLEKIQAIAYWERVLIKDIINKALQGTVEKYEKKHGAIKYK